MYDCRVSVSKGGDESVDGVSGGVSGVSGTSVVGSSCVSWDSRSTVGSIGVCVSSMSVGVSEAGV